MSSQSSFLDLNLLIKNTVNCFPLSLKFFYENIAERIANGLSIKKEKDVPISVNIESPWLPVQLICIGRVSIISIIVVLFIDNIFLCTHAIHRTPHGISAVIIREL